MKVKASQFIPAAQIAINDPDLQTAVTAGTHTAFSKRQEAMFAAGHEHGETMRQQAAAIKRHVLNNLPDLLEQAEANMQANGIKILWAVDGAEANRHVLDIARRHQVRSVVKSKSMVTEEVGLNHALETAGIDVLETDLGEYIVQLGDETPSHIVAPILHKTKASIRDLLVAKANMPPTDDTEEMTRFAREALRRPFLEADMGVSGGNFIIAETGSLCLVTNEGNARLVTSLPPVHVALVGIEKVIATVADYATLTQILPRSANGQPITVYTHLVNGPRQPGETDGPEHVYVILVDNGRSHIYDSSYAEALACIRCGACLNGCPVYQVTGGHAYGWVYSGPIGAVITPLLTGLENASPLPYASTLCGMCRQVCPVDIDIPRMLLDLRRDLVAQGQSDRVWDLGIKAWAWGNRSPGRFALGGRLARMAGPWLNSETVPGPLAGWTKHRTMPQFAPKSFRQLWQAAKARNSDEQS
jgi:L-lactate dehydrogenase complex protein LldF